jgi:hypothetical protein
MIRSEFGRARDLLRSVRGGGYRLADHGDSVR